MPSLTTYLRPRVVLFQQWLLSAAFASNLLFPVEVTGQCSFAPKELIAKLTPWFPKRQVVSVVFSGIEVTVIAPKPAFCRLSRYSLDVLSNREFVIVLG